MSASTAESIEYVKDRALQEMKQYMSLSTRPMRADLTHVSRIYDRYMHVTALSALTLLLPDNSNYYIKAQRNKLDKVLKDYGYAYIPFPKRPTELRGAASLAAWRLVSDRELRIRKINNSTLQEWGKSLKMQDSQWLVKAVQHFKTCLIEADKDDPFALDMTLAWYDYILSNIARHILSTDRYNTEPMQGMCHLLRAFLNVQLKRRGLIYRPPTSKHSLRNPINAQWSYLLKM